MSESNSDNPYQPPESDDVLKPTPRMTAGAVVLGVILGVTLFLTTCFGGGFIALSFAYGTPYFDLLMPAVLVGSVIIALLGTALYERRLRRKVRKDRQKTQSSGRETKQ